MITRRNHRIALIWATVFVAVLVVFFIPQTGLHQTSKQYINHLIDSTTKSQADGGEPTFNEGKWWFQEPMPQYELPDISGFEVKAAPHNYRGPGRETYATFYTTRNADSHDPYFLAAQQIVYRILWDPRSRTSEHPMTVFVTPFISQEQRNYFLAAGAIVRELPLRPFVPEHAGAAGRLKDMFSKLEMWYQLDFSRIAYLDSDAFPIDHTDDIFKLSKWQMCNRTLLPEGDKSVEDEICRYTFTGYKDFDGTNAGVLVFNPNEPMYGRLVRESLNQSNFDNGLMEQSLLHYTFNPDGPFPPGELSHEWNAGPDLTRDGGHQYIVHHKLWDTGFDPDDAWQKNIFKETWADMLKFYKSEEFKQARREDGPAHPWG